MAKSGRKRIKKEQTALEPMQSSSLALPAAIPKLIHFVWIGSAIPQWASENIQRFRDWNPDYKIYIHDESVLLPELKAAFNKAHGPSSQSDLLRYSALKRFGGWYFDVDFFAFRSLHAAVDGWGLDGRRFFVSKQQGHSAGAELPYNATPIACHKDHPALDLIIQACIDVDAVKYRTAYGPYIIKKIVNENPELFEVADAGWFFPLSIQQCKHFIPYLKDYSHRMHLQNAGTASQLPIAAHLWAEAVDMNAIHAADVQIDDRPVVLVQDVDRADHPLHAIADGFAALGFQIRRSKKADNDRQHPLKPEIVVFWNGLRHPEWPAYAREMQAHTIQLEHGFFQRQQHSQVDHKGFLHRASWRSCLQNPAPTHAAARLRAVCPDIQEMKPRTQGYILVLGQVSGDTQLLDSEIQGPAPLHQLISRTKPAAVKAFFRPHPLRVGYKGNNWPNVPVMSLTNDEQGAYLKTKGGNSLQDAIDGARFVIAINSNGLNDALIRGCPAMAFGPMLGIDAGVIKPCSMATFKDDLDAMLKGWCPRTDSVLNYLEHLAAHQFHCDELKQTETIRQLLKDTHAPQALCTYAEAVPA